jgi:hypothetical protein
LHPGTDQRQRLTEEIERVIGAPKSSEEIAFHLDGKYKKNARSANIYPTLNQKDLWQN